MTKITTPLRSLKIAKIGVKSNIPEENIAKSDSFDENMPSLSSEGNAEKCYIISETATN